MITNRKWSYFAGAAVLGAFFLLRVGAPPLAVLLGIAAAALLTVRDRRSA